MVLRQREDLAVAAGIQLGDAFVVLAHVDAVFLNIRSEVEQQIIFHVHLHGVGMAPEHIGQLAAPGARFQQGPVVVPVDDFDLDRDAGNRGPVIGDLLQALLLVGVPNVHVDGEVCGVGRGHHQGHHHGQGKYDRQNTFHGFILP